MRRAARVDGNQAEIVAALRTVGATVLSLAAVGKGCPDLLVAHRGVNYLLEVKDPSKAKSDQKLTKDQVIWHEMWTGQVDVVKTVEDALEVIGVASG